MAQKVQIVPHNFWHGFTSLAAAIWFLLMHKASCISLPVAPIITSLILCLLEHGEISYSCKLQPTISAVFCWFSDAFWYVHLEYLEPVVYTWWALVLWGPCMPWKACLLFWHWVLPWLHKTPPLAMLWPSCAACSLLNCWCTNQLREEMQWCKQLPLMIPQCSSQHCFLLRNIDGTGILLLGIMKCRGSSVYDNALRYDLLKSHFKW